MREKLVPGVLLLVSVLGTCCLCANQRAYSTIKRPQAADSTMKLALKFISVKHDFGLPIKNISFEKKTYANK